jgi:hypothetical protein
MCPRPQTERGVEVDDLIQQNPDGSDVLLNLRSGWVADQESAPPPRRAPRKRSGPSALETLRAVAVGIFLSLKSTLVSLPGKIASAARGMRNGMERGARSDRRRALAMIVLFAGMVTLGALAYAGSVGHIFDEATLSRMMQSDSPAAVATAPPTTTVSSVDRPPDADGGSINSGSSAAYDAALKNLDQSLAYNGSQTNAVSEAAERLRQSGKLDDTAAATSGVINLADTALGSAASNPAPNRDESPAGRVQPAASNPGSAAPAINRQFPTAEFSAARLPSSRQASGAPVAGGKAAFDLRQVTPGANGGRSIRVVVTKTTVQLVSQETGAVSMPLASIKSVQVGKDASGADLLNIDFRDRGRSGRMSFRDATPPLQKPSGASAASAARGNAHLTQIRNVILAAKGRS